jgi:hypothetical protein
VIEQNFEAGSQLDITLTLPAEIAHGTDVFMRALGKVVRVERRMEDVTVRMGVAAVIERYDIIRGQAASAWAGPADASSNLTANDHFALRSLQIGQPLPSPCIDNLRKSLAMLGHIFSHGPREGNH